VKTLDVLVIGGGQAGLAMGYHLRRLGLSFEILDGNARVGDSWRARWDSLVLFTPARYSGLPGLPFPAPGDHHPGKEEVADYLADYARHFDLPVESGTWVTRLEQAPMGFVAVTSQGRRYAAAHVNRG
jgi:putative flavoprotein involved in K+ transport